MARHRTVSARRLRFHRPSLGTVLGGLALFVAGTGTATAAGSLITIQDGSTAATAKVDNSGRLSVLAPPAVRPSSDWRTQQFVSNYYSSGSTGTVLAGPTTASLALAGLTLSNSPANPDAMVLAIGQAEASTVTGCSHFTGTYRDIYREAVPSGGSVVHEPTVPLTLKPLHPGVAWCLTAIAYNLTGATSSNSNAMYVHADGWVLSGAFTPPTSGSGGGAGGAPATPAEPLATN